MESKPMRLLFHQVSSLSLLLLSRCRRATSEDGDACRRKPKLHETYGYLQKFRDFLHQNDAPYEALVKARECRPLQAPPSGAWNREAASVAVPGLFSGSPCTATIALRRKQKLARISASPPSINDIMDPGLSHSNPIDSPSSSNVLLFWEAPISDLDVSYTQNNPTSFTPHPCPLPPPILSAGSSSGACEPLDNLTENCKLLGLDDKLEIEQGDNYFQDSVNYGLAIGDGNPGISNVGHDMNVPSLCWAPDGQLNCVGCQVLREVSHSNGIDIIKLQIHGTVGFLYHGIIEVVRCGVSNEAPISIEQQLVDFSRHSFEEVKHYLKEYGQMRAQEGFSVIQDSLCTFYDCLCTGMSSGDAISRGVLGLDANGTGASGNDAADAWMWGLDADGIGTSGGGDANSNCSAPVQPVEQSGLLGPPILQSGLDQSRPAFVEQGSGQLTPANEESALARLPRSNIAAQRQRTGKLKLNDLIDYFHLPIQLASKKLGLCSTVLKKICRRNGLKRWPYRKIKGIDKNIHSLQQSLATTSGQENASVQEDIERLQRQKAQICAGIASTSDT